MMRYFEWICENAVSIDWKTMNYVLDENRWINIPLSVVVSLHLIVFTITLFILLDWWWYRHLYRTGYEDGYTDGVISKAVKLGKLKFGDAPSGIVIYETSKEEFSNEIETAFQERKQKNKNT